MTSQGIQALAAMTIVSMASEVCAVCGSSVRGPVDDVSCGAATERLTGEAELGRDGAAESILGHEMSTHIGLTATTVERTVPAWREVQESPVPAISIQLGLLTCHLPSHSGCVSLPWVRARLRARLGRTRSREERCFMNVSARLLPGREIDELLDVAHNDMH